MRRGRGTLFGAGRVARTGSRSARRCESRSVADNGSASAYPGITRNHLVRAGGREREKERERYGPRLARDRCVSAFGGAASDRASRAREKNGHLDARYCRVKVNPLARTRRPRRRREQQRQTIERDSRYLLEDTRPARRIAARPARYRSAPAFVPCIPCIIDCAPAIISAACATPSPKWIALRGALCYASRHSAGRA